MMAETINLKAFVRGAAALIAGACLSTAAPAQAKDVSVEIDREFVLGGEGDLLEKLISLDAAGIAEMRADLAEALVEIDGAIEEIKAAREEINEEGGVAKVVVKVAFATARSTARTAIDEAMDEAREEVDEAEARLKTAEVSAEERIETQGAIDGLRIDLAALDRALRRLMDELHV